MTFLEIYGTRADNLLGTADRTQRFKTALRQLYANDGQKKFNEQTGCYVKRLPLAIVDGTQEYDIETAATDFLWPSGTTCSLKRVGTSTSYLEGPNLEIVTEETLNNIDPNWRAAAAGIPEYVYWRNDGGSRYVGLHPTPSLGTEAWTLLLPYVAQPPDMSGDSDEPFGASAPRITLRPYHDAVLFYEVAQLELIRKDVNKHEYWMKRFAGEVARYSATQAPKSGQGIRLAINPRRSLRSAWPGRSLDPTRYP